MKPSEVNLQPNSEGFRRLDVFLDGAKVRDVVEVDPEGLWITVAKRNAAGLMYIDPLDRQRIATERREGAVTVEYLTE